MTMRDDDDDDYERRWRDDEDEPEEIDPRTRLAKPALGIIVVAGLCILTNCVTFGLLSYQAREENKNVAPPPNMNADEKAGFEAGKKMAPAVDGCCFGVPTLAVYGLMLAGGLAMQKVKSRGLAIAGAVAAIFPCSPMSIIAIPIGIWALIVLLDADVAREFKRGRRKRRRPRTDED